MRVLFASPMPPQPQAPGAIPLVLHAQLAGLKGTHQITLVTVAGPDPAEWVALDQLRTEGIDVQAVKRAEPQGRARWQRRWRFATTWLGGFYPWRTIWFWEPEIQRILDRLLAENRFDLVQIEDNAMGIYRFHTQLPTLFTEHEVRRPRPVDWQRWSQPNVIRWGLREADWQRWPRYQRSVWRQFDRIQTFTPRDAESVRALMPELSDRVRVNPFGVDVPSAADPALEERDTLIFVGNYTHPPNVDAALWLGHEIMPRLRAARPGVRLLLVGIYPPLAVQALACEDIVVTGPVPQIEPWLARAAVVVAPARIGGGQRMKVLYAMASGKAVVTTSRGIDGLAFDGQHLPVVVADDVESMVEATKALLASPDARRDLGRQARTSVMEHYSVAAYARRLEAAYRELVNG